MPYIKEIYPILNIKFNLEIFFTHLRFQYKEVEVYQPIVNPLSNTGVTNSLKPPLRVSTQGLTSIFQRIDFFKIN